MLRNSQSDWIGVSSGVPQGSVLGPILFIIYINDLLDGLNSNGKLFADDAKIYRRVNGPQDVEPLQSDLDKVNKWSEKWLLKFNENKCTVMHFGATNNNYSYFLGDTLLSPSDLEKDLGIHLTPDLRFKTHINKVTAKANSVLSMIRSTFRFLDVDLMKTLYQSLVRPHLEYAVQVWSPSYQTEIDKLERIQRRATKITSATRHLPYDERLELFSLTDLETRRLRGDLIQTYKIIHGIDGLSFGDFFEYSEIDRNLRGHQFKLYKPNIGSNIKKFSFGYRVIEHWNSLPNAVVGATSISSFKKLLDKEIHLRRVAQRAQAP